VPAAVVTHLASRVGVPAEAYVAYDWRGRTIKYHRAQIHTAVDFRETSVEDAEKLVDWLTNEVVPRERALDRVRSAVYARCRELRLEPPTLERIERLVRSALASHEQQVSTAVRGRLSTKSVEALDGLLTPTKPSVADGELARAPLVELKADPRPGRVGERTRRDRETATALRDRAPVRPVRGCGAQSAPGIPPASAG